MGERPFCQPHRISSGVSKQAVDSAADGDFANLRLPNKTSRSETSYGPLARWPILSLVAMFALMVLSLLALTQPKDHIRFTCCRQPRQYLMVYDVDHSRSSPQFRSY